MVRFGGRAHDQIVAREGGHLHAVIVDDSEACRRSVAAVLDELPELQVVDGVCCGEHGLERIRQSPPDVVLLDVSLPDISGVEVGRRVRAEHPEVGIVFVTSFDTIGHREAANELGAGFVVKGQAARDLPAAVREQYGRAARASENLFNAVVEAAHGLIVLVDEDEIIRHAGGAMRPRLSSASARMRGRPLRELVHPNDLPALRAALAVAAARERNPRAVSARLRTIEDRWCPLEVRCRPLPDTATVLLTFDDVSERERSRAALEESEQRFRQLAETITEVFWMTNISKSEILYVSPAYEATFGRTCQSLYQDPMSWREAVHPADRERVVAAVEGAEFPVGYDMVYRIVRPDGMVRWLRDRAFPVCNAAGEAYRIVGVATDVTERRELETRLEAGQMLEAVGRLAASVAHDFNNMLSVIQCESAFIGQSDGLPGNVRESVQEIVAAADSAGALTRQLLAFGARHQRTATQEPTAVDLGDCATRLARLLQRVLGSDIAVVCVVGANVAAAKITMTAAEQVVTNLLFNARDAMEQGGTITLTVAAADGTVATPAQVSPQPEWVVLSVKDSGHGISAEHLGQIFDPYFSTKGPAKGTGLGLATVSDIVRGHGGWIDVASAAGEGATFRVFLPAVALSGRS